MYNGVQYAEHRTLISSHERATGSHFISGTVENVYNTSHMKELTAKTETIFLSLPLVLANVVALPRSSAVSTCAQETVRLRS